MAPPPEIAIHDLAQGRAVLQLAAELGRPVQLRSAPAATAYAGIGYLHALGEALGHALLLDCGDRAGDALAALRQGCQQLTFSGPAPLHAKLAAIAAQQRATVRHEPAPPHPAALLLPPDADLERLCRPWLLASDQT